MYVPLGGCIPMFSNLSLCVMGRTMASTNYNRKRERERNEEK